MTMKPDEFEAYSEAVRWIVWGGIGTRRAGTLGYVVSLVGKDSAGSPIEARHLDTDAWRLMDAGGNTVRDLAGTELVGLAGGGSLTLTAAKIRQDLPALLFQAAVAAAEDSLTHVQKAEGGTGLVSDDPESGAAFEFMMAMSEQDAAVRSAIPATVFAVATAEAQVNGWAAERGGWVAAGKDDEDRLCLVQKCKALAAKAKVSLDVGRQPYQDLRAVVKRRDELVHAKSEEQLVPLVGPTTVQGRSLSVYARQSCSVVRRSLVDLARAIGEDPPRYLAYCPPCEPDDDEGWRRAVGMTGAREDPDFPKVMDLLRAEGSTATPGESDGRS
jgi:hypothetical protein